MEAKTLRYGAFIDSRSVMQKNDGMQSQLALADWMFMRDNLIHGNYTMRPLLKTMDPEEAARFRSMLANP